MSIVSVPVAILSVVLIIGGSLCLLLVGIAMWRSKDTLSRLNQLSTGIMVDIPALVTINLILGADQGDLTWGKAPTAVLAIVVVLAVVTIASKILGHAVLGTRDDSTEGYMPKR